MKVRSALFLSGLVLSGAMGAAQPSTSQAAEAGTRWPIKHLIVVVGENATFDALFATYRPAGGASMRNLVSKGIINADGSPGINYYKAVQYQSQNLFGAYTVNPIPVAPYAALPLPTLTGTYDPATLTPNAAIPDPRYSGLVTIGPFQITGKSPLTGLPFVVYGSSNSATGDPVHRFFQMWQQTGGTNRNLTGFAWTALTAGQGAQTPGVFAPGTSTGTGQGAELMGFFNMAAGDAPVFAGLASRYAVSDNYHQAIMGGTGANFFALATGDLPVYNVGGVHAVPPANQIENPNPAAGTDNFFKGDGYAGGSYVNCADATQPGVGAILLNLLVQSRRSNCAPGAYYLVNNYNPPFDVTGAPVALGASQYVYPPQTVPTIGEALTRRGVSWSWYTGGREDTDVTSDALYVNVVYPQVFAAVSAQLVPLGYPAAVIEQIATQKAVAVTRPLLYNAIGDPHNGSATVVNSPTLKANLKGLTSFYGDVSANTLPAVSWVVPKNLDSGHPGYSAPARYEVFVSDLIARVKASPAWQSTAILITTDEGGGYFDSGRIQPLDFFGDGPRIPLIVVSPYAASGRVDHVYNDHASILKFIERNWGLAPLSIRSRDRLRDPVMDDDGYLPVNGPAIGDLSSLFTFGSR